MPLPSSTPVCPPLAPRSSLTIAKARSLQVLLGCVGWLLPVVTAPALSAERVYVSYNILERSIPVSSLETYARTGRIDEDLEVYAQYADQSQLTQLRTALVARADLSPVAVSQFLYSPQGEILLRRLGRVIQSESRQTGFKAIRAALILASADSEGLTLLNVLRKFPTRGLRIDVQQSLQIVSALERVISQTNQATTLISQQAIATAPTEGIPPNGFEDLRQPGPYRWQTQTTTLIDLARRAVTAPAIPGVVNQGPLRGRLFPVDLYLPTSPAPQPAPVIVISHGLGSDRESFVYLAQHLASYGFAVLVPEHPGSNAKQLEALVNGTASEVAEPTEFVDRPLDVTYLLNEIDRQVSGNPALRGRLNLQQVGVLGQSFGGYTALALAGAPIRDQIPPECSTQSLENTLNLSLLLQCQAFQPGQIGVNLRDPRVKAIVAANPITSAVFGQTSLSQIAIPTMLISGNADTIAPALSEQIQPFTWLTTPEKFLVLLDRGTHFSVIGDTDKADDPVPIPDEVIGPSPITARRYLSALSVAFFQTYLANQPAYRPYLSASYTRSLSQSPIPLSLVQSLTGNELFQTRSPARSTPATTSPELSAPRSFVPGRSGVGAIAPQSFLSQPSH